MSNRPRANQTGPTRPVVILERETGPSDLFALTPSAAAGLFRTLQAGTAPAEHQFLRGVADALAIARERRGRADLGTPAGASAQPYSPEFSLLWLLVHPAVDAVAERPASRKAGDAPVRAGERWEAAAPDGQPIAFAAGDPARVVSLALVPAREGLDAVSVRSAGVDLSLPYRADSGLFVTEVYAAREWKTPPKKGTPADAVALRRRLEDLAEFVRGAAAYHFLPPPGSYPAAPASPAPTPGPATARAAAIAFVFGRLDSIYDMPEGVTPRSLADQRRAESDIARVGAALAYEAVLIDGRDSAAAAAYFAESAIVVQSRRAQRLFTAARDEARARTAQLVSALAVFDPAAARAVPADVFTRGDEGGVLKGVKRGVARLALAERDRRTALRLESQSNKCPHVHLARAIRREGRPDRADELLKKLRKYLPGKAARGARAADWLVCRNCGFRVMCPHVLERIELERAGAPFEKTRAALLRFVDRTPEDSDRAGQNVYSRAYHCRICAEEIGDSEVGGLIGDLVGSAGEDGKPIRNLAWTEAFLLAGRLQFSRLVAPRTFAAAAANVIHGPLLDYQASLPRRKRAVKRGPAVDAVAEAEQEAAEDLRVVLRGAILARAFALDMARQAAEAETLARRGDPRATGSRAVGVAIAGAPPGSKLNVLFSALIRDLQKERAGAIDRLGDISVESLVDDLKAAYGTIREAVGGRTLVAADPARDRVDALLDDPRFDFATRLGRITGDLRGPPLAPLPPPVAVRALNLTIPEIADTGAELDLFAKLEPPAGLGAVDRSSWHALEERPQPILGGRVAAKKPAGKKAADKPDKKSGTAGKKSGTAGKKSGTAGKKSGTAGKKPDKSDKPDKKPGTAGKKPGKKPGTAGKPAGTPIEPVVVAVQSDVAKLPLGVGRDMREAAPGRLADSTELDYGFFTNILGEDSRIDAAVRAAAAQSRRGEAAKMAAKTPADSPSGPPPSEPVPITDPAVLATESEMPIFNGYRELLSAHQKRFAKYLGHEAGYKNLRALALIPGAFRVPLTAKPYPVPLSALETVYDSSGRRLAGSWKVFVYRPERGGKEVRMTRGEIAAALKAGKAPLAGLKLVDRIGGSSGELRESVAAKQTGVADAVAAGRRLDRFFLYYDVRCPVDGIHEFAGSRSKCKKCGLDATLPAERAGRRKEALAYAGKYRKEFEKTMRELRMPSRPPRAVAKEPVNLAATKAAAAWKFDIGIVNAAAKLAKVSPARLLAMGSSEGREFADIDRDPEPLLDAVVADTAFSRVRNAISRYNRLRFYARLPRADRDAEAILKASKVPASAYPSLAARLPDVFAGVVDTFEAIRRSRSWADTARFAIESYCRAAVDLAAARGKSPWLAPLGAAIGRDLVERAVAAESRLTVPHLRSYTQVFGDRGQTVDDLRDDAIAEDFDGPDGVEEEMAELVAGETEGEVGAFSYEGFDYDGTNEE